MPWLACLLFSSPVRAQYDLIIEPKPPQANSREELDGYLNMLQFQDPAELIAKAKEFSRLYPTSEFLGQIYRMEMRSYQALNDQQNTVAAGERVLRVSPKDPEALLTLAKVLPSLKGEKEYNLNQAERHAQSALEAVAGLRAPRSLTIKEFEQIVLGMQAGVHEALGIIAFQREQYLRSVSEFEEGIRLHPAADGGLYYRLGVAYRFARSRRKAEAALRRAIELGPAAVRSRAEGQLAELHREKPVYPEP
jgi:tetratricopeptide (TPR) repeat protein